MAEETTTRSTAMSGIGNFFFYLLFLFVVFQSWCSQYRTHDFPTSVEMARELGLPVSTETHELVYELMDM